MVQDRDKIAMLTCYDASFAAVLEEGGVDTLLIGDSLGNVLQGHESTLPVTLRDIVYHTECVARGSACLYRGRHAVLYFPDIPTGNAAQRGRHHVGGRPHGENRGRPPDGGDGGISDRPRHTGLRTSRPHAPVSSSRWAATRCRVRARPRPSACCARPSSWSRRARACSSSRRSRLHLRGK